MECPELWVSESELLPGAALLLGRLGAAAADGSPRRQHDDRPDHEPMTPLARIERPSPAMRLAMSRPRTSPRCPRRDPPPVGDPAEDHLGDSPDRHAEHDDQQDVQRVLHRLHQRTFRPNRTPNRLRLQVGHRRLGDADPPTHRTGSSSCRSRRRCSPRRGCRLVLDGLEVGRQLRRGLGRLVRGQVAVSWLICPAPVAMPGRAAPPWPSTWPPGRRRSAGPARWPRSRSRSSPWPHSFAFCSASRLACFDQHAADTRRTTPIPSTSAARARPSRANRRPRAAGSRSFEPLVEITIWSSPCSVGCRARDDRTIRGPV